MPNIPKRPFIPNSENREFFKGTAKEIALIEYTHRDIITQMLFYKATCFVLSIALGGLLLWLIIK